MIAISLLVAETCHHTKYWNVTKSRCRIQGMSQNVTKCNEMKMSNSWNATFFSKLHSSVGSVADLRTGGRKFDYWFDQYSFRGLMIVVATGSIPLSPLSVVSTMVLWESSQCLGKNIVRNTG